ncbi:MAG: hypothetical protein GY940_11535 [bacterium]|nr:hypothetical protein [bacterium]
MMKDHEVLLHGILGASVELEFKHRELLEEMGAAKKQETGIVPVSCQLFLKQIYNGFICFPVSPLLS